MKLTRRGLLTGAAAVALTPAMPAPTGFWVIHHPTLPPPTGTVAAMVKETIRAKMRADVMSGRVRFPPVVTTTVSFAASGHQERDT